MSKSFLENGFIINLSEAKDTSEIISELGNILELPDAKNKDICLKLGAVELSQSQLLSIKALISLMGSKLTFVNSKSEQTQNAAKELELDTTELINKIEVTDDESSDEIQIQEIQENSNSEQTNEESKENEYAEIDTTPKTVYEPLDIELSEEHKQENKETTETHKTDKLKTLYLNQTLRSGQTMSCEGNLVLIGDTHPGSEIIASGDITVWGILGGIAHAGSKGNTSAKIRALKLNAIQLRIASFYARRQDTTNIPYVQRSSQFVPEEASISDNAIVIKKMNEI